VTDIPLPNMPNGLTAEQVIVAGLRRRYLELAARVETDATEMVQIKDRIRLLGRGSHPVGDGLITITANKQFDAKTAEEVLTNIHPDLVAKCSKLRIDAELTKQNVSGEVYALCQKEKGDDKVLIK